MRQGVFTAVQEVKIQDVEVPKILPHQVLLKVAYVGVCGSDIQIYNGKHKHATYPVVPGHEVSAVVEEVGSEVAGYARGNKVTCLPQIACGECYPCQTGRFNVCEKLRVMGVHLDGFLSEYVVVDPKMLCACPDDMPLELITLVEPLAVGIGSIKRGHYPKANIVVIGAGTIGNLIAQSALALDDHNVLVTDILDPKLDFARECGVKHTANTLNKSLEDAISETFGSRKADIIIDAAATASSFGAALKAARPSSEIIITGNYKEPVTLEVPLMQRREVNLIGHMMYVKEDFETAIELINSGKVNVEKMITKEFELDRFSEIFDYIKENGQDIMKILVRVAV